MELTRAYGAPLLAAQIRRRNADFQVSEELGFEPSGDGEHDFLWIEKCGANTAWVARQLARIAGVGSRDVGYCGQKDRHALTRQWFSVRRPGRDGTRWGVAVIDGVRILDVRRNARKLRRGAHRANRFCIALRGDDIEHHAEELRVRVAEIAQHGIPNYVGEQRFGHDAANLRLAERLFSGKRLKREARGYAISAARSVIFNAILNERVRDATWCQLIPGDLANLDGTGSVFAVDEVTAELQARAREQDIHPTATLWGDGAPLTSGDAGRIENCVAARYRTYADGLKMIRMDADSRALRARVGEFSIKFEPGVAWLEFRLGRGVFATTLLAEIVDYDLPSST